MGESRPLKAAVMARGFERRTSTSEGRCKSWTFFERSMTRSWSQSDKDFGRYHSISETHPQILFKPERVLIPHHYVMDVEVPGVVPGTFSLQTW